MDLLNSVIMENLIAGRVILGLLCFAHLLINYAGAVGAFHKPISQKGLKAAMLAELIAVTAYVVYDNIQTPPYDNWTLAIIGYVLVYGLILMTWEVYSVYALLDKDDIYAMKPIQFVTFGGKPYLQGLVEEKHHKIDVLLPREEFSDMEKTQPKMIPVKFKQVLKGREIIVTLA